MNRKLSIKLTSREDMDKVRRFQEAKTALEQKSQVLVATMQERLNTMQARMDALVQEQRDEEEANKKIVADFQQEYNDTLFHLWRDVVEGHLPETDMQKAFMNGGVFIDMAYYEEHGDAFLCYFQDNEELPDLSIPENRVLH